MQTEAAGEVGGWTGGTGILPVLADRWLGSNPVRDPVPGVQPAPHKPSFLGTCAPGQSSSKTAAWARCHRDRRARSRGSARRHQLCRAEETICRHGLPETTPWGAVSRAGNRIQHVSGRGTSPVCGGEEGSRSHRPDPLLKSPFHFSRVAKQTHSLSRAQRKQRQLSVVLGAATCPQSCWERSRGAGRGQGDRDAAGDSSGPAEPPPCPPARCRRKSPCLP